MTKSEPEITIIMLEHKDYLSSLNRARKKRNQRLDPRYLAPLLTVIAAVGIIVLGAKAVKKPISGKAAGPAPTGQARNITPAQADPVSVSPEKEAALKKAQEIDNVISSYSSLGIAQVSGYLNIRETPSTNDKIIGKLSGDGTCEILAAEGDWSHTTPDRVEGYISNQYLLTGDGAREKTEEFIKLYATVAADNLNIHQAPALGPGNVIGQALKGERYVVKGLEGGWIQIEEGYISSEYAEVAYSLDEGRRVDMKVMAINQCDNLVIPKVNNYSNIYQEPKSDSKIIGKMTSKAVGRILEILGDWYKIKSGPIIGYILAGPQYMTIDREARDIAIQDVTLKVVANTDVLNVCTEPNTDAKIWTQTVKDERYSAMVQLGGWVGIDLDSVDEEDTNKMDKVLISTRDNNVEVRYVLSETAKFSPVGTAANNVTSRRSKMVSYVLQYMGNPYIWGGTNLTEGVGCSGFTMQVMRQFDVFPPHYSGSQAKMGKAATSGNIRPDNLIFYTGSGGQVDHVAIYIGSGQVVHAASRKGGIKISTWNHRSPVAIRDVLDDQIKNTVLCSKGRSTVSVGRQLLCKTL